MFTSSTNRRIWRFHVIVVLWTSKKRDARGKLCFAHKINCLYVIVVVMVASVLSDYLV